MTNEEIHKEEIKAWLESLYSVNTSRLKEIAFIEKQILHKAEEMIHINDQIELTKKLIKTGKNDLEKL